MTEIWLFVAALAAVYLVPGADMMLVLDTAATSGRARAGVAALGLASARAAHVGLAAIGLAALLHGHPRAFEAAHLLGGAYLVHLGIAIYRSPPLVPGEVGADAAAARIPSTAATFRAALLTNLLNPKALLFCSILLPQFVDPNAGSVAARFAVLGAVLVAVGLAFDTVFAVVGSGVGHLAARHPTVDTTRKLLFGTILIGLGARLAVVPFA